MPIGWTWTRKASGGDMGEHAPADVSANSAVHERHRKTYQMLLVIAVCLAVVGAPMLMDGAVALAKGLTEGLTPQAVAYGLARFAVGAAPMVLAAYTWGKVRGLERVLEDEELHGHSVSE